MKNLMQAYNLVKKYGHVIGEGDKANCRLRGGTRVELARHVLPNTGECFRCGRAHGIPPSEGLSVMLRLVRGPANRGAVADNRTGNWRREDAPMCYAAAGWPS